MIQQINTISLDLFQAEVLGTKAEYERSYAILARMDVGWSPAFISSCYPRASRNLIANLMVIRKLSIGLMLSLYVALGYESFVKGPLVLFTQELADLRLDGLLTLIRITYGRLGGSFVLLRYPEQLQGPMREFDTQMKLASYRKLKNSRTLLL